MKEQNAHIIKDLIISILVVICIVLILSVIFYDKISLSKVIPESQEYLLTDEMQQELEETNLDDAQEVVTKYYIDAADLKKYEKTKEYNKGKQNPFAEDETPVANNTTNDVDSNDGSTSSTINNSDNFYEDDGTK